MRLELDGVLNTSAALGPHRERVERRVAPPSPGGEGDSRKALIEPFLIRFQLIF